MRRLLIPLLAGFAGCHACQVDVLQGVEGRVTAVASVRPAREIMPCTAPMPPAAGSLDLAGLWELAVANNPSLREAAADVEAARGRLIQADKYPNPRLGYREEELGTRQGPAGSVVVELNQEIVTGGKRRLDLAIAKSATDAASLALLSRKFEVLSRIRRLYFDYLGLGYTVQVNEEVVAALQQGVAMTRQLVEVVQSRERTDLLRLQALLEEAKINLARGRVNREAAWRQLAAEVGVPELPMPEDPGSIAGPAPVWDAATVLQRVLAVNTELKRAALETEHAHLEVERARAEAVPNVTVGGGYSRNFAEHEAGAVLSVETPLPLWDRKQGRIYEAQAHWARAQAAQRTTATRLNRETAEAFGRYQVARLQVDRLTAEVLPRLGETLDLVRKGYRAGAATISFADVLLAEQSLNDARLRLADAHRALGLAIADLKGLMQLDVGEELCQPSANPGS